MLLKAVLVALAALAGAFAAWRARGGADPAPSLLRFEAGAVVVVAAAASVLAALPQGRGQALPAQRGTLLAGPAFASALTSQGPAALTLAPARTGLNRLVASLPSGTHVRLACGCAPRAVDATLRAGAATVRLPAAGQWYAYVEGATAPAALTVGVPRAPGAPPVEVVAAADLSGAGGAGTRCRDLLAGLELAVGRLNALGGLDGGRKVALAAYDTGGAAAPAPPPLAAGRPPPPPRGARGARARAPGPAPPPPGGGAPPPGP